MAEHEVKEQDKSDELVDMIEKLMEDGSGHLTRGRMRLIRPRNLSRFVNYQGGIYHGKRKTN